MKPKPSIKRPKPRPTIVKPTNELDGMLELPTRPSVVVEMGWL